MAPHPKMYSDDDPYLVEVRKLALAYPEAIEVEAHGRPTFRTGKVFCWYTSNDTSAYGIAIKPDPEDRPALLQDHRFYIPKYLGPSGWLTLDFEAAPVDWAEVDEFLDASYRQIALKRQLKALDDRG